MRKKFICAVFVWIGLGSFAVYGSPPVFLERFLKIFWPISVTNISEPSGNLAEAIRKAGRAGDAVPVESQTKEVSETSLWRAVFDFAGKIETKAAESVSEGKDDNLYSRYFTRQGPLTDEHDAALKRIATGYRGKVAPLDQRAKKVTDDAWAKHNAKPKGEQNRLPDPPLELSKLQKEKESLIFRSRDELKAAFGSEAYNQFVTFLKTDFSKGATSRSVTLPSRPESQMFFDGYTWIIWDDEQQPPLITGLSELYFYYDGGFYYDPSLDSFFGNATTGTLLEYGRDDGYRDFFPARFFHSVFASIRGNQYCTITDFYSLLYDGPILIEEKYLGSGQVCHVVGPGPPPSPTPTPNVISVTYSQGTPSSEPISQNPQVLPHNPGIGQRIFADDDTPNDSVDRRQVRVTATLSQPVPNVRIYFRNFDLDDPATDTTIDPPTPPGATGDNVGVPNIGQLLVGAGCGTEGASIFCPTNASGVATVDFIVTRQPGDNFAIAASVSPVQVNAVNVNGIELTDSGGQNIQTSCPTQTVCRGQMLTVWRRLHIEVDSMGPSTQNFVVGNFATGGNLRRNTTATFDINSTPLLEANRFANGRLTFGSRQLRVVSNTATSVIVTNNLPGQPNPVFVQVSAQFQMYDDDDFNNNNGAILTGDSGEDIPMLQRTYSEDSDDVSLNRFASSYIRPKYDTGDNNDATIFAPNVATDDAAGVRSLFDFDQMATEASQTFWTVYLLSAYQHVVIEDGDPLDDNGNGLLDDHTAGIVDREPDPLGIRRGRGAVVFLETNGFKECFSIPPFPTQNVFCDVPATKIHEIGHLLGAEHGHGGVMDDLSTEFSPTSINAIRNRTHP